jgi:hypothetical protein
MTKAGWAAGFTAACFLLLGCGDDASTESNTGDNPAFTVGATIDANADGMPDDRNGDGVPDKVVDSDGNGVADGVDTNGDGIKDASLPNSGGSSGSTNGNSSPSTGATSGGTTSSNGTPSPTTGEPSGDDGGTAPTTGGGADDPATPGNDSDTAVQCGKDIASCDTTVNACCATGNFPSLVFSCNPGASCSEGAEAVCDGSEECGGQACCVEIANGGTVSCKASCGLGEPRLCHTDQDCSAGETCKPGGLYTWWGVCG